MMKVRQFRRRIVFVADSLRMGGAERVLSMLVGTLAERRHEVTLITLMSQEHDFYPLHPDVRRITLPHLLHASHNIFEAIFYNFRRLGALRHTIQNLSPEVAISFIDTINIATLISLLGSPIPAIVSERLDPRIPYSKPIWRILRSITYRMAAAIVVQTDQVARQMPALLPGSSAPVRVIPNPVDLPAASGSAPRILPLQHVIIAVGRLETQKGFDLLVEAFSRIAPACPEWGVVICGEGSQRAALEEMIRQHGLSDRVALPGAIQDIAAVLASAELFVLSSRFEGFPNALLEAMSLGLSAISFDCPSGPADIIQHGVNGLLVPPEEVEALAAALRQLIDSSAERQRLGSNARQVRERFSLDKITDQWMNLIEQVIQNRD
jgi:glycosyltransferase involved in cell wall biosynthesis